MSVTKLRLSSVVALSLLSACGLTNPFDKAAGPMDAGPSVLEAPLAVRLETASPTHETSVALTAIWCGRITSVLVNEGTAPTSADAGWVPCVTDVGAITYNLPTGGGAHFLHVWGRDADGRITDKPTQVTVVVGDSMFALGDSHSCVLIAGTVKCWGSNLLGQLGDGSEVENSTTPVVPTGLEGGVEMIVSGSQSRTTCALRGGQVWCWGVNNLGQLGTRTPTTQCTSGTTSLACSRTPVPVVDGLATPLSGVVSLHGGGDFFCARLSDASVRCWGSNASGQLGDGQVSGMSSASPIAPGLSQDVSWVTSGFSTTCAKLDDGSGVSCWGLDYARYPDYGPTSAMVGGAGSITAGSLQIGKTPRHNVALDGADLPDVMVLGYYHACALFSGDVKCWGLNRSGQVGNGLRANTPVATLVSLPEKVDLLVGGTHHACARLLSGTVQCWGMNDFGQLALTSDEIGGEAACSRVPLATASLGHVAALGAGREQSCAATDEGIVCWGADASGLLQGAATETCTVALVEDAIPCSHTPVVMKSL